MVRGRGLGACNATVVTPRSKALRRSTGRKLGIMPSICYDLLQWEGVVLERS